MAKIVLFCSARTQIDADFMAAADPFAEGLRSRQMELAYGGGKVGLMTRIADAALSRGVRVTGVIPDFMQNEIEVRHPGLDETIVVPDLMERKRRLIAMASAFVIFPGGYGTLDEALEVITMKSLGLIGQPVIFVNLKNFWRRQLEVFAQFEREGFTRANTMGMNRPKAGELFSVADSVAELFVQLDQVGVRR